VRNIPRIFFHDDDDFDDILDVDDIFDDDLETGDTMIVMPTNWTDLSLDDVNHGIPPRVSCLGLLQCLCSK